MPVDQAITIRGYQPGDEQAILDLFARSFPHDCRTLDHFRWKYQDNPFGSFRISVAIDAAGCIVAHYAGYPVPFRLRGRDVVAHQVGDTMTDRSVRHIGRGRTSILGRTAFDFFKRYSERKVVFNYGFNVANIHKFSQAVLRGGRVEPVALRVLHPGELTSFSRLQRLSRGFQLERVTRADRRFDEYFGRASAGYELLIRRDAQYLQWRYLDCPVRPYVLTAVTRWRHLVAWIVYRLEGTRMILGDMLLHRECPEAFDYVLDHVARLHSVTSVEGWFSSRPDWLARFLDERGFVATADPSGLALVALGFLLPEAPEVMRRSLYYTWGDSDLF